MLNVLLRKLRVDIRHILFGMRLFVCEKSGSVPFLIYLHLVPIRKNMPRGLSKSKNVVDSRKREFRSEGDLPDLTDVPPSSGPSSGWFQSQHSSDRAAAPPQRDPSLMSNRFSSLFRSASLTSAFRGDRSAPGQGRFRFIRRPNTTPAKAAHDAVPSTAPLNLDTPQHYDNVAKNNANEIDRLESLTLEVNSRSSTFTRDAVSASRAMHFSRIERPLRTNEQSSDDDAPDLFVRRLGKQNYEWNDDDSELVAAASRRLGLQEMVV